MRQSPGSPRKSEPPTGVRSDRDSLRPSAIPRAPRRDKALSDEQFDDEYEPSYSVRLIRPFLRVLQNSDKIPAGMFAAVEVLDCDQRIPVSEVHRGLDNIVELTGDRDIGLKAAYASTPGDGGALDYAISSASTARDAIYAAGRYIRLVNDTLELRLETLGNSARIVLENRVSMPRAAIDFQLGALFRAFAHVWSLGSKGIMRVSFAHAAPDSLSEYQRTFAGFPVDFGAKFNGFTFEASSLSRRLASADSILHDVILGHAETMLAELPPARQLTERVRNAIVAELAGGNPSVTHIAPRLHMSPRTLERKLEREGTTFSLLLDDLRKRLALRYVASNDLELAEIAFLLGFARTTGFHRAFKRWTGETPLHYRRTRHTQERSG
jgi:AraC-like DNA-binding protein